MNTKVLIAAIAGAVTTFLTGWLFYGILLGSFFESNSTEAARAVVRGENMIYWAIFVGCLAWSTLMAMIYSRWAGITTWQAGASAGAWIGFLIALGADFFAYGSMDTMNLTAVVADVVVNAVQGAISGAVVGFVLGYGQQK